MPAHPKPEPKVKRVRPSLSEKPRKPVKKVNPKRRKAEFLRAYGSAERVEFVRGLPCVVPGCDRRPSENAHYESGGKGRKADADKIAPLCGQTFGAFPGHHQILHNLGRWSFEEVYQVDLAAEAVKVESAWLLASALKAEGK